MTISLIILILFGIIFLYVVLRNFVNYVIETECKEFPEEYNYRCFDCNVIDDEECRNCEYRFEGVENEK